MVDRTGRESLLDSLPCGRVWTRVRIPPKAPMKQTRGRGIDNPGGAFADDGEPLQDTGEALYGSPYTGIPASQRRR
nr:MAG TPA: hypothetical protein [Caudoviricetes sp.]